METMKTINQIYKDRCIEQKEPIVTVKNSKPIAVTESPQDGRKLSDVERFMRVIVYTML